MEEIEVREPPSFPCDTLYFGGGTPSLLAAAEVAAIVEELSRRGWLAPASPVSLEANPEDATKASLAGLRDAGVETLSLGVQSLDPETLRFYGRRHTREDAIRSVELARTVGFGSVSIDLMYGAPFESEERLRRDLMEAVSLEPDHISCYQLTVHERTLFGRRARAGKLSECADERQATFFRLVHRFLGGAGYAAYEVSNFARAAENRSRHNRKYWLHAPYLGLGPSAHSFDGRARTWNERSFFAWERRLLAGESPSAGREDLDDGDLLLETLMLRLRTPEGVDLGALERRFGIDLERSNRTFLDRACREALLIRDGSWIRPTLDGLAVADGLARSFNLG
jgi:oxygen-independent coproporphyrinogen-3 oxidase